MYQEFVAEIKRTIRKEIAGMHTALPGKIEDFDMEKCLAAVTPIMKYKKPNGEKLDYPRIDGVPVVFPQGNDREFITAWPVKKGDKCLLIISEQSLDLWQYGIDTETDLKFDLSNAICIPGLYAPPHELVKEATEKDLFIIKNGEQTIRVKKDKIEIKGDVYIEGKLEVDGVDFETHRHTDSEGGGTSGPL